MVNMVTRWKILIMSQKDNHILMSNELAQLQLISSHPAPGQARVAVGLHIPRHRGGRGQVSTLEEVDID